MPAGSVATLERVSSKSRSRSGPVSTLKVGNLQWPWRTLAIDNSVISFGQGISLGPG